MLADAAHLLVALTCWHALLTGTTYILVPHASCHHLLAAAACLLLSIANATTCCKSNVLVATECSLLQFASYYHMLAATSCLLPPLACNYLLQMVPLDSCYRCFAASICLLLPLACLCHLLAVTYCKGIHLLARYNLLVAMECLLLQLAGCYFLLAATSCLQLVLGDSGDSSIILVELRTIAIARVSNCYIGLSRTHSYIVMPIHCMIVVDS